MKLDEAVHGVDYHDDGCDMPGWLLVLLLAFMCVPVGLVIYLLAAVL